jgi:hypothetical protein
MKFKPSSLSYARPNVMAEGVAIPGVPGVAAKTARVLLNDKQKNFLKALRAKLDFDVMVTSGIRTVQEQASAMWRNLKTYGYDHMDRLYAADVTPLRTAQSVTDVERMIQDLMDRGKYISDHLKGEALDFRTSNLTADQKARLKQAIFELGIEYKDEPDHFHVEGVGGLRVQVAEAARSILPLVVVGLSLATTALGSFYLIRRHRRRRSQA